MGTPMSDRTKIADALEQWADADEANARNYSFVSTASTLHERAQDLHAAAGLLRADPDTSDERKPCPHCNDEGVVCTHDGDIIGPCDCTSDDLFTEARQLLDAAMSGPLAYDSCFVLDGVTGDVSFECDSEQTAALFAAAPRLIAALLAERDADVSAGAVARTVAMSHIAAERDAERAARERAEAEARQLREAIRAHENLHRPDGPDGADGPIEMDGWPCCNDDRLLWAAAVAEVAEDRGQTDD